MTSQFTQLLCKIFVLGGLSFTLTFFDPVHGQVSLAICTVGWLTAFGQTNCWPMDVPLSPKIIEIFSQDGSDLKSIILLSNWHFYLISIPTQFDNERHFKLMYCLLWFWRCLKIDQKRGIILDSSARGLFMNSNVT